MRGLGKRLAQERSESEDLEEAALKKVMQFEEVLHWCGAVTREECWAIVRPERERDSYIWR
jgi:hypothetical protein